MSYLVIISFEQLFSYCYYVTLLQWVGPREIIPKHAPHLGSVLRTLCSTKIIRAENAQHQGTQLKLMLTLLGNQKAVFKPQW